VVQDGLARSVSGLQDGAHLSRFARCDADHMAKDVNDATYVHCFILHVRSKISRAHAVNNIYGAHTAEIAVALECAGRQ